MYSLSWILLVTISLWISLIAFIWALWSGQFSGQGRARYLPLADEMPRSQVKPPSKTAVESYALLGIILLGLSGLMAAVVLSLYWMKGIG